MYLKSLLSVIVVFVLFSINGYSSSNNNAGLDPPILSYDSHIIDDDTNGSSNGDGDNHAEAGESIEMPVATINTGEEAATNTSAVISCADADINITDNYEFIGTIHASIESRIDFDGDVVGVFVDDKCRGIAERMYFPFSDSYFYIIQVYSNIAEGEEMTFKYFDSENGEVVEYAETMMFTSNMVVGNGFEPFGLSREFIIPPEFSLSAAYPNPFNPTTTISFGLAVDSEVSIQIYNLQGRAVETLADQFMEAGYHSIIWNADNHSSGVYFVRMVAGDYVSTQKLLLVK